MKYKCGPLMTNAIEEEVKRAVSEAMAKEQDKFMLEDFVLAGMSMTDYQSMDCQRVKGLNCATCDIASCTTSVMRTPVSKLDAEVKKADMSKLEWDKEHGMYFIKRNEDKSCQFFDPLTERCSLPLERRFNSCLVYPVRVYQQATIKVILNRTCPSALSLFDMVARREPSSCKYISTASKIFTWDADYRRHVLKKTKGFDTLLLLGDLSYWTYWESGDADVKFV
jgi:Fe-S-cluster containining protein